jgi:hypothetical protein
MSDAMLVPAALRRLGKKMALVGAHAILVTARMLQVLGWAKRSHFCSPRLLEAYRHCHAPVAATDIEAPLLNQVI